MWQANYQDKSISGDKKSRRLLSIILVVALLAVAGSLLGYFYFKDTPEEVIAKMSSRLAEIESLEYQGEIIFETAADLLTHDPVEEEMAVGLSMESFKLSSEGQLDIREEENPKMAFSLILEELAEEGDSFDLDIKSIDQTIYFRLNKLPDLRIFDLSSLADYWFKIDVESIGESFGIENIDELMNKQKLSSGQMEEMNQAFCQSEIIEVTKELANEKVKEINAYHYEFLVDLDNLRNLIIETNEIAQGEPATEEEIVELDESLQTIKSINGEIWIGKKDLLPYKIFLEIETKETDIYSYAGQMTMALSLKNYNQPMQIEAPPAVDLEEMLEELFSAFEEPTSLPLFEEPTSLPLDEY